MKEPTADLPASSQPTDSLEQIQERIRRRAYELYEQRRREDGHDLDDWLTAESEIIQTGKP